MKNNIKSNPWIWIMIWLMIVIGLYYFVTNSIQAKNTVPQVCNDTTCFTVEIADTSAKREKWLMYRENLGENDGMLFIFPTADYSHYFWMKNTLIPLDMIRIDDQFKVVSILTAQPCTADPCTIYNPNASSTYVLEINGWLAKKNHITEWSTLEIKNIR